MKPAVMFVCILLLITVNVNAEEVIPKGPLYGKNLYLPFLIHYNNPSLPARSGEAEDLKYHISLYYAQDVQYMVDDTWTERQYDKNYIFRDYESFVAEAGISYNFRKHLEAGIDMRVFSYYGGFLDPIIEGFHSFFGFPNAGREFFLQNQLYVNIPNNNGADLFLDKPALSFGDIDLWGKWTFLENNRLSLALLGALKLPTGKLSALSGSGYPDIALGLLMDFRASRLFTLYVQAGGVLPFNKSYPMFNGLAGVEIHPWESLSFVVQTNIKTSPISNDTIHFSGNIFLSSDLMQYSLPQTNLLVGVIIQKKNFKWQFYFEEDALTHQGTDITFNVMFSHTINLRKQHDLQPGI